MAEDQSWRQKRVDKLKADALAVAQSRISGGTNICRCDPIGDDFDARPTARPASAIEPGPYQAVPSQFPASFDQPIIAPVSRPTTRPSGDTAPRDGLDRLLKRGGEPRAALSRWFYAAASAGVLLAGAAGWVAEPRLSPPKASPILPPSAQTPVPLAEQAPLTNADRIIPVKLAHAASTVGAVSNNEINLPKARDPAPNIADTFAKVTSFERRHVEHDRINNGSERTTHFRVNTAKAMNLVDSARHPSFSCRQTGGSTLAAICGDRRLAALDRLVASRFAFLDRTVNAKTVQVIHHGQTAFLNKRQGCPDRACLVAAYRKRLRELNEISR